MGAGIGVAGTNIMPAPSTTNAARSITCINGSNNLSSTVISTNSIGGPSLNIQASPAYGAVPYHKSSIPGLYSHYSQQGGRVTVFGGGGFQGVGAGSPTKSMSSGMFSYPSDLLDDSLL